MADYLTHLSFEVEIKTRDEKAWVQERIEFVKRIADLDLDDLDRAPLLAHHEHSDILRGIPEDDLEIYPDFLVEIPTDEDIIWFTDDAGAADPWQIAAFVKAFLVAHRRPDMIAFEWADTCTKPRIGAFGGGAMTVTATAIDIFRTSSWTLNEINDHNRRMR